MHFDFTVHVWTLIQQILALSAFGTFLWHIYKAIRSVVNAANAILDQHKEVYTWYRGVKDRPWPAAGD